MSFEKTRFTKMLGDYYPRILTVTGHTSPDLNIIVHTLSIQHWTKKPRFYTRLIGTCFQSFLNLLRPQFSMLLFICSKSLFIFSCSIFRRPSLAQPFFRLLVRRIFGFLMVIAPDKELRSWRKVVNLQAIQSLF